MERRELPGTGDARAELDAEQGPAEVELEAPQEWVDRRVDDPVPEGWVARLRGRWARRRERR